jgi:hypothetical protein
MRTASRWLVLAGLALTLTLAACGGSDAATATKPSSSGAQSPSAATAAVPDATATAGASGSDMPRGKIVVTGAVSQEFTAAATCGGGALNDDLQVLSSSVDDGEQLWFLQIYVNNFVVEGPKDYAIGPVNSSYDASVNVAEGGLTWSTTDDSEGHITINQDGKSGAVQVTASSDDGGQPVTIAGSFVCEAD